MNTLIEPIDQEGLASCLKGIEAGAMTMRDALLSKNHDAIMNAVKSQELLLAEFARLWEVSRSVGGQEKELVKPVIGRIRSLLRQNAVIARAFLDVINGTMDSLNERLGRRSCGYDETGRASRCASPILVQCQG
jgi:hypothetical protein